MTENKTTVSDGVVKLIVSALVAALAAALIISFFNKLIAFAPKETLTPILAWMISVIYYVIITTAMIRRRRRNSRKNLPLSIIVIVIVAIVPSFFVHMITYTMMLL